MPSTLTTPSHTLLAVVPPLVESGQIAAPYAVIDIAAFDHNAEEMAGRAGGLPIRVASKSLRSVTALRRALDHDGFTGILSYSVPEAIRLAREGFDDIVVAYPCVNSSALRELAADKQLREAITVMVDCEEHLELIGTAAQGAGPVKVAIDLDCTLHLPGAVIGPRRSPVRTPEQVDGLARRIVDKRCLRLVGVMAYEGQVASVADAESGVAGSVKRWLRRTSMEQLGPRRKACIDAARAHADLEFVNGGGTGSLDVSAAEGTLTELAAGSGFYTPVIFDHFATVNHRAAAFFICQVSRIPARGWATVNSGGWIASGPPAADRVPVAVHPSGLRYSATEGAGEVQTPLHGPAADSLAVGDLVWFRHAKAGEMTEHVDGIVAVHPDGTAEMWDTYRGNGWTLR